MNGVLESEIQQDQSMALVLTDVAKTDRLEAIIRDLMIELSRTSILRAPQLVLHASIAS